MSTLLLCFFCSTKQKSHNNTHITNGIATIKQKKYIAILLISFKKAL